MPVLDKEVVQFTRDGIVKKNLATGESTLVTHSDHAREMRYKSPIQESVYHSSREHSEEENSAEPPTPARRGAVGNAKESEESGESRLSDLKTSTARDQGKLSLKGAAGSTEHRESDMPGKGDPASGRSRTQYKYGQKQKDVKYYYRARTDVGKIPTSAEFQKSFRHPGIGKRLFHYTEDHLFKSMVKKDDNPGLEAAGTAYRSVRRFRSGMQKLREINQKRSLVFRTTERVAVPFRGTSTAVVQTSRTAQTTVQVSGTVQKAAGILKNPVVAKYVLIALAIFLGMVLLCMLFGMMTESFVGSTVEHPELTEYVEQLDSEFLKKIDALKDQYGKDKNSTVKIEGDEQINTDPNVLAIMATGDWVVMDLTPENKEKLEKFHGLLNTYSVTKTDEKVKEEIPASSGSAATVKTKTVHHITIQVRVYSPEEIISKCGYTDTQQKNVLDMLDFLYQITGETGDTPNTTTSGYYPVGGGEFQWPVPGHSYISSGYGTRIDPITKAESAFHTGLDIPAAMGTSVLASADGTVIRAGWNSGFGNCVIIQHKNGVQTLYGHNSALVVKKGDVVRQGQVIAKIGSTGRSTGPHCHFEFRIKGHHVNPSPYLKGVAKE
jgi:Membrane proteins related to metalloendopeptidases